ncbi:hypothetical protein [Pararhizobium sp.]|uniref:hypothetical protein n=1 Tax=Pararhizobium sp. TaxID=1977563 RepID=UPI002717D6AA|nr:hypothetical protein [Pararhizobium sp.]MDO9418244.1 hypothetical protein [Pararhizobium sp.]
MSAQISRYLKDFSAPRIDRIPIAPKYFPDLDDGPSARKGFTPPVVIPQIDVEAERREAFEEGRAEAVIELNAKHQAAIAALEALHATQLQALQARCEIDTAAVISARFSEMTEELSVLIGDQVAQVLAPVMSDTLVEKSIRDLAVMITNGIRAGEAGTFTVKGPAALFEALKQHLAPEDLVFRHQETGDTDLSVEYGDTILVTRMAVWSETVRKVLA